MDARILEQRTVAGCTVSAVIGDLTEQRVDAIVNAANSALAHGGGRLRGAPQEPVGHRPLCALLMWFLLLASAHRLLGMRCAHPEEVKLFLIIFQKEFVPHWPSDNNSVSHARRRGQCGTNS
jgi:hypothetical protein